LAPERSGGAKQLTPLSFGGGLTLNAANPYTITREQGSWLSLDYPLVEQIGVCFPKYLPKLEPLNTGNLPYWVVTF
jgi:hypothetical protein